MATLEFTKGLLCSEPCQKIFQYTGRYRDFVLTIIGPKAMIVLYEGFEEERGDDLIMPLLR